MIILLLISSIYAHQFNIIDNKIYLDHNNIVEINPINTQYNNILPVYNNSNISYKIDDNYLYATLNNLDGIILLFTQPINNYYNIINIEQYQLILDDNELIYSVEIYTYYMYIYFVTNTNMSYNFLIKQT
jgi:hypothetical protein